MYLLARHPKLKMVNRNFINASVQKRSPASDIYCAHA